MQLHYLEVVTRDVDLLCATCAAANGVTFDPPDPLLGNARTAPLAGGWRIGLRAPLHEREEPIVRPYWLVPDIHAALTEAEQAGSFVAHTPLEIPGYGTFAIYIQGGIQHGLWQK